MLETIGSAILLLVVGAVCLISLIPFILPLLNGIDSIREHRAMKRQGYRHITLSWPTEMGRRFGPKYDYVRDSDDEDDCEEQDAADRHHPFHVDPDEDRYGVAHQNLRAAWKDIIRLNGADCMERVCLMPSRRIEVGASWDSWDLAHDHQKSGRHEYLGPAHKVCNQAEALHRGVTWEGAPLLSDLLDQSGTPDPWADDADIEVDPWATPSDGKRVEGVKPTDPWATPAVADNEPPF